MMLLQSHFRLGVLFSLSLDSTAVGCVAKVVKHEKLTDDRFFLLAKGQERFGINKILRSKPYLVVEVSWLEDRPPDDVSDLILKSLSSEIEGLMRDVLRISNRLNGKKKEGEEGEEMDLRRGLFPTMFSFFVGSTFERAPRE